MKYLSIVFLVILTILACDPNNSNSNSNNQTKKVENDTTEVVSKWLCIPNKQVGLIVADADEEKIISAYGKENVIREEVGVGEGEVVAATIVFPKSPNELIVEWQEGFEYKKLSRIRIEKPNAQWETEEGIKIGTTLDELLEMNGKDFNFYGFEWDYGGITNDWDGGKINSQLTVFLDPKNSEAIYPDLTGDGVFPSSHPKAKEAQLEVAAIVIYFGL